jgi:hypothetical protein
MLKKSYIFVVSAALFFAAITVSAHEFYVAPDGDDSAPGTLEQPFATITHARDVVRKLNASMTEDITVFIRKGTYYLKNSIELTEQDSGRNGHYVIYRGYKNEYPVIAGGEKVKEWQPYKDGIMKAPVGKGVKFWSLLVNNRLADRGKLYAPHKNNESLSLANLQAYFQGAWMAEYIKVTGFSEEGTPRLKYSKSRFTGRKTILVGDKSFIRSPGEWGLDSKEGFLYLKPAEKSDLDNVLRPTCSAIFRITGKTENQRVRNIKIMNLELILTDFNSSMCCYSGRKEKNGYKYSSVDQPETIRTALVSIENADDIHVKYCIMHEAPLNAVSIYGAAENNEVYGCRIFNIGYNGIYLAGYRMGPDTADNNRNNTVSNNEIFNILKTVNHSSGILIYQSGGNKITHNMIHNSRRYAISIKGQRFGCLKDIGINIDFNQQWKYIFSNNNLLAYNYMYNLGNDSHDGGGLETWGGGRDNTADHNIVIDAYSSKARKGKRGHGIFLDDGSNYWTVTNNIIYNTHTPSLNTSMNVSGVHMNIDNNVMDISMVREGAASLISYVEKSSDQLFTHNIVFSGNKKQIAINGLFTDQDVSERIMLSVNPVCIMAESNFNLYALLYGKAVFQVNSKTKRFSKRPEIIPLEKWRSLTDKKFESQSLIIDSAPGFINLKEHDYRLRYDSPALTQLNIKSIDTDSIGLLEDYPFAENPGTLNFIALKADGEDTLLKIESGKPVKLTVTGRTTKWYTADLSKAAISYSLLPDKEHPGVAEITKDGILKMTKPGIVVITAEVTLDGVTKKDIVAVETK